MHRLAPSSALAACFHAATAAPLAGPAKKKSLSCSICHCCATGSRIRIHKRTNDGNKPIGRRLPSAFGINAIITIPMQASHLPASSAKMKMRNNAAIASLEHRASARGWRRSQPRPVAAAHANVHRSEVQICLRMGVEHPLFVRNAHEGQDREARQKRVRRGRISSPGRTWKPQPSLCL